MSWANVPLTRRRFILSTAVATASSILWQTDEPLHVSIIGFGRHAERFLAKANRSIHVDAVVDPNLLALRSASVSLGVQQSVPPRLFGSLRESRIAESSSPIILCSPPHTWSEVLSPLKRIRPPVLAHHTHAFCAGSWRENLELLSQESANVLLVGFDPAFPLHALRSLGTFARARGAINTSFSLRHIQWPPEQLLAFYFDCLNAAVPSTDSPGEHCDEFRFLPLPVHQHHRGSVRSGAASAECSISMAGPGLAVGGQLYVSEIYSADRSPAPYLLHFAEFCRASQATRGRIIQRQSGILRLVDLSRHATSFFT